MFRAIRFSTPSQHWKVRFTSDDTPESENWDPKSDVFVRDDRLTARAWTVAWPCVDPARTRTLCLDVRITARRLVVSDSPESTVNSIKAGCGPPVACKSYSAPTNKLKLHGDKERGAKTWKVVQSSKHYHFDKLYPCLYCIWIEENNGCKYWKYMLHKKQRHPLS